MNRLQDKIAKKIRPAVAAEFNMRNVNMSPRVAKIVVNVGIRSDLKDPKFIEDFIKDVKAITGQQPVQTRAKQSVSSFKIRQGQTVGLMVTLRGARMYEFLDKLLNVALARVRDFRGLPANAFDRDGNYSIGFRDQIAFPEISPDSVTHMFGLQITIVLQSRNREHAMAFFKHLGLPLKKDK